MAAGCALDVPGALIHYCYCIVCTAFVNAVEMFINKCQITEVLDELSSHTNCRSRVTDDDENEIQSEPLLELTLLSSCYVLL